MFYRQTLSNRYFGPKLYSLLFLLRHVATALVAFHLRASASEFDCTMPADCSSCNGSLKRHEESLTCSKCSCLFHIGCLNVSHSEYNILRREKIWSCPLCRDTASASCAKELDPSPTASVSIESVLHRLGQVEKNFSTQLSELKSVVVRLQTQLQKQTDENSSLLRELQLSRSSNEALTGQLARISDTVSPSTPGVSASREKPKSYSQAASQRTSIVVRPKDSLQANSKTKIDLLKTVNPVTSEVDVVGVKHISNGGIIISCSTDGDAAKLKQIAGSKLSERYEIKDASKLHPRIRISGLTERHDSDSLVNFLKVQNSEVFADSKISFISSNHLKKRNNIFQAVFQVDPVTYHRALNCGKVFMGYDSCNVHDALEVLRCFNCCGYHHVSANCKSKTVCPRCTGDHKVDACDSQSLKCINCCGIKTLEPNIDVNHAAWDRECAVYKRKLTSLINEVAGSA